MPDMEDILAELARRGINPAAQQGQMQQPEMGDEQEPQMPLQMQQGMAEQAQAQALNPAFQQQPVAEEAIEETLSPQQIKGLMLKTPEKKSTKKPDIVYPSTYDYEGTNIDLSKADSLTNDKQRDIVKQKIDSSSKALAGIEDIEQRITKLKTNPEYTAIQKLPFVGSKANKMKEITSILNGPDSKQRRTIIEVQELEAELDKLRTHADNALREGNSSLPANFFAHMEKLGTHPTLNQGLDTTEAKLKSLRKHMEQVNKATSISFHTNKVVQVHEVDKLLDNAVVDKYIKSHPELKDKPRDEILKILKKVGIVK